MTHENVIRANRADDVRALEDRVNLQVDRLWEHLSLIHRMIAQVDRELSDFMEEAFSRSDRS